MDCYQRAVSGVIAGALSVFVIGEAFHAGEDHSAARKHGAPGLTLYPGATLLDRRALDDEPHRERHGPGMLRYPTIVSSASSTGAVTAATASEDFDLRGLSVTVTLKDSRFVFGQEARSA